MQKLVSSLSYVVEVPDWNSSKPQIVSLQQQQYISYQTYYEGFFPRNIQRSLLINFNTKSLHLWVDLTS